MRPLTAPPGAAGALLVFLGMLAAVLPAVTAFELPVYLGALLVVGALLSVYIATLFSSRRAALPMLLLLAAAWAFVFLRWRQMLLLGAEVAVSEVVNLLALGVEWLAPVAPPEGVSAAQRAAGCTLFIVMLSAPVMLLYGWSLIRLSAAAPCIVVSLPFFAVSMVLMDRPPSLFSVLCAIAFWALLLLTQGVRRASPRRGAALVFAYLPLVAALCAVVLLLSPREGYVRAAWPDILRERILVMRSGGMGREDAPTLVETVERVDASRPDERVDVSTLGPRRTTGATVLEVRDEAGGALYLRGSALGRYDGAAWGGAATDPPAAAEGVWQEQAARLAALGPARALSVRHLAGATEIAYAPYYPVSGEAEAGEAYASVRRAADAYGWTYVPLDEPDRAAADSAAELAYRQWAQEAYTDVPEALAAELRRIAAQAGIDASAPRETLAQQVAAYIRQAAYYDLEAERAPAGEDFILYFLTQSRRGYCVHFASAATAMLQSLGVPARYVSGYLVEARPGEWTAVTDENAHAWTEVYVDGFGWTPLEVTGSAAPPAETDAPEATAAPGETAPPAETDAPDSAAVPGKTPPPAEGTAQPVEGVQPPTDGADSPGALPPDAPGDAPGAAEGDAPAVRWSPYLLLLLAPPALLGALVVRRRVLLERRARRLRRGSERQRILAAWREVKRLERYGVHPPERLAALALEARFSNHVMTAAQRGEMADFLEKSAARLPGELPPLKRLAARYLFVSF